MRGDTHHKPIGMHTQDLCQDLSHSPHVPQRCQGVGRSSAPPQNHLGPGAEPSPGAADVPWSGGDTRLVIGPAGRLTPRAQHSPAAGQGCTEQLLFPAHSPTHPPPAWKNKSQLLACFQTNSECPHIDCPPPPTAAGTQSWRDGHNPRTPIRSLPRASDCPPPQVGGSLLCSPPRSVPSLCPHGQVKSSVLGRC